MINIKNKLYVFSYSTYPSSCWLFANVIIIDKNKNDDENPLDFLNKYDGCRYYYINKFIIEGIEIFEEYEN